MVGSLLRYFRSAIRIAIKNSTVFRANVVTQFVGAVFSAYLLTAFWSTLFREGAAVEGITLRSMVVYAVGTVLLNVVLNLPIEEQLAKGVRSGDVALAVTRPLPYPVTVLLDAWGEAVARLVVRVVPYGVVLIVLSSAVVGSNVFAGIPGRSLLLATCSGVLAVVLGSLYQLIFGTVAFWTGGLLYGVVVARREIARLLSGSFVPLWFFPEWAQHLAAYLPFQGLFHIPLSILIGKIDGNQVYPALALQAAWIGGFAVIALAVWKRASRRVEIQGG